MMARIARAWAVGGEVHTALFGVAGSQVTLLVRPSDDRFGASGIGSGAASGRRIAGVGIESPLHASGPSAGAP